MKTYKLINKEYFSFLKTYKEVLYQTTTNSIDEAVENLFMHLKAYKFTRAKIRSLLEEVK